ncbi:hypothetical protein [Burkholderia cepacia]|uniref:hypothetical protein n=1 Tax=Burkholderia cepacia TaxID=292 RepID=UPI0011BFD727|nr:hypothetical protein [Burkholderia cepacia]MCE4126432.1 hypothetical protein [Burkholderia cepacia]
MKISFLMTLVFAMCLHVGRAEAAHICWIDQVSRVDGGVKIDFRSKQGVLVISTSRADASEPRTVVPGTSRQENSSVGPQRKRSLVMAMGDTAAVMNIPEDYCEYKADMHDGQIGVTVRAIMRLHGLPPNTTIQFIAAE